MSCLVVYPGTFDPITNGHVNIIHRALEIYDSLVVAVASNINKHSLFSIEERVEMIQHVFEGAPGVKVEWFDGLLVNYMKRRGANVILRGLRTVTDFEYEFQMALTNKMLNRDIETVFMMTDGAFAHFSSTIIKEVVVLGGSAVNMVPEIVEKKLRSKFQSQEGA